jgi:hypothetical protein
MTVKYFETMARESFEMGDVANARARGGFAVCSSEWPRTTVSRIDVLSKAVAMQQRESGVRKGAGGVRVDDGSGGWR